jgi:predicted AAA+ superfamily ATPase
MFPLTFEELADDFNLDDILHWGSLPSVWTSAPEDKKAILRSYVGLYLREEIQAERIVRNLPSFSRFLALAAESASREVNYTEISRETGVTSKTIREYYSALEETLIGFFLPPWKKSVRKQLAGSPKFYLFDNGVTNALMERLSDSPKGEVRGTLLEQWLLQEVRAIMSYHQVEGSMSYWKARGGHEVDLVISRGPKPILAVEIKHTSNPGGSHFAGLRSFGEEYPKVPKILVTLQDRPAIAGDI